MRAVRSTRHPMRHASANTSILTCSSLLPNMQRGGGAACIKPYGRKYMCVLRCTWHLTAHLLVIPNHCLMPKPTQLTKTPPKRMAGRRPAATPYPLPGIMILCEGKHAHEHQCTRSQHRSHQNKRFHDREAMYHLWGCIAKGSYWSSRDAAISWPSERGGVEDRPTWEN